MIWLMGGRLRGGGGGLMSVLLVVRMRGGGRKRRGFRGEGGGEARVLGVRISCWV